MDEESKAVRQFTAMGKATHDRFGEQAVGAAGEIHAVNTGSDAEKARNILELLRRLTESGNSVEFWTEGTVSWCQIQDCVSRHFWSAKGDDFWQAMSAASRMMPV